MSDISRHKIRFVVDGLTEEAFGELVRFLSPKTVDSIAAALPLEGRAALWKEEVYFEIPVKMGIEKPRSTVETAALAYWPMGSAFCIFHGTSQPYSPVNLIGRITENLDLFRKVKSGAKITVSKC